MADEIIAEVRRHRDALSAKYGYDIRRIFDAVGKRESESGKTYVITDSSRRTVRPAALGK